MNHEQLEMVELPLWFVAVNTDGKLRVEYVDAYDNISYRHNGRGWIGKHFLCGLINRGFAKIIENPLEAYALEVCVRELQ